MWDNEYTAEVLNAFRFRNPRRWHKVPRSVGFIGNEINRMALAEQDSIDAVSFKHSVIELMGTLVSLPASRVFDMRPGLVQYMMGVLDGSSHPRTAVPLLMRTLDVENDPYHCDEFDIWREAGLLLGLDDDQYPKKLTFPFLRLPREVRERVYVYYFDESDRGTSIGTITAYSGYEHSRVYYKRGKRLALLRVMRQVHAEATSALFANFVVRIQKVHELKRLHDQLSATSKSLIRYLHVRGISHGNIGVLTQYFSDGNFSNIRTLRLDHSFPPLVPTVFQANHLGSDHRLWTDYDKQLAAAVEALFERSQGNNIKPSLELSGFTKTSTSETVFPPHWNVSIEDSKPSRESPA